MSSEEYFEGYRDHLSGQWKWAGNWSSKDDVRCLIEGSEEMLESMRQL